MNDLTRPQNESGKTDRRMGVPGSETWTALLDAAELLMKEKGHAAVTSRRLAAQAGLSPQIVYFYFRTMDDLFEALFERLAGSLMSGLEQVAHAPQPLLALWELGCDPTQGVLMVEFMSLSNHRKQLQRTIGAFGVEFNRRQTAIIAAEFEKKGVDPDLYPPQAVAAMLDNAARGIAFGQGYDIDSHVRAREFGVDFLRRFYEQSGRGVRTPR